MNEPNSVSTKPAAGHPHSTVAKLRRKLVLCSAHCRSCSQIGASGKPGTLQTLKGQTASDRKLQILSLGVLRDIRASVGLDRLGLDLIVFELIRTRHHSREQADALREHVMRLPELIDFYRIGGDWDYMLKVITPGMAGYDSFYQRLITGFDFGSVQGIFSMERILDSRPIELLRVASGAR